MSTTKRIKVVNGGKTRQQSVYNGLVQADEPNALAILKKVEQKLVSSTMYAELEITIQRPRWTKKMALHTWSKGKNFAAAYISSPEKDKGTIYMKNGNNVNKIIVLFNE